VPAGVAGLCNRSATMLIHPLLSLVGVGEAMPQARSQRRCRLASPHRPKLHRIDAWRHFLWQFLQALAVKGVGLAEPIAIIAGTYRSRSTTATSGA